MAVGSQIRVLILPVLIHCVALLIGLWSTGAVRYAFGWSPAATALYGGVLTGFWLCSFRCKFLLLPVLLTASCVGCLFLTLTPEKRFVGAEWLPPWSQVPAIEPTGDRIIIRNVRDFHYRSTEDYDIVFKDITLDPNTVESVDIAISHWNGNRAIAHTMLSFGFPNHEYLAVSLEIRAPVGVIRNFLGGMYRQYELLMILGTEEDLYRLRTDFRDETLYLYRTNATPEQCRQILDYVFEKAHKLQHHPEFYNSLFRNCTTSLAPLLRVIDPDFSGDVRLIFNGFSGELLYELGYLACREDESFNELKRRRRVNQYLDTGAEIPYSMQIRTNY